MQNKIIKENFLKDKEVSSEDRELIVRGWGICNFCKKIIPAEVILKNGFSYLFKKCIFEGTFSEMLLGKDKIHEPIWKRFPSNWPHFSMKIGDELNPSNLEKNIVNLHNILALIFCVTMRCNSHCRICLIPRIKQQETMQQEDVCKRLLMDKLRLYRKKLVMLCGGEPTVREDLPYLIDMISLSGNIAAIHTNGLKLADKDYLRILKNSGLKYLHFSFDGFKQGIYSKVRGGKDEFELKIRALENLKEEKINTVIRVTLIRGVNEDQIYPIIRYAQYNEFISEIIFQPLILFDEEENSDFGMNALLSPDEIANEISKSLNINADLFDLLDDLKTNLMYILTKRFPNLPLPIVRTGVIRLKRDRLAPILNIGELQSLVKEFKKDSLKVLINQKFLKLVLKSKLNPLDIKNRNKDLLISIQPLRRLFLNFYQTQTAFFNPNFPATTLFYS